MSLLEDEDDDPEGRGEREDIETKAIWKTERPANASIPDNAAGWDAILDAFSITLLSTMG